MSSPLTVDYAEHVSKFVNSLQIPHLISNLPFMKSNGAVEFAKAMFQKKVFISSAETSSGKTLGISWLLIQFLNYLDANPSLKSSSSSSSSKYYPRIVITVPLRLMCLNLVNIMNTLTGNNDVFGYCIGGEEAKIIPHKTKAIICTNGWFVHKLSDSNFSYDFHFHDEAHTPSSDSTMTELAGVHRFKQQRESHLQSHHIKSGFVIASATIDLARYEQYFEYDEFSHMDVKVPRTVPNPIVFEPKDPVEILESIQKKCPEGKILNEKTGRCINDPNYKKAKPVKEDKPKPVKEDKPKLVKEDKPKPVKEDKPKPVKEDKPKPEKKCRIESNA